MNREQLESSIQVSLSSTMWVDGLQNQVRLRTKAIKEVQEYIESIEVQGRRNDPKNKMISIFTEIFRLNTCSHENAYFDDVDDVLQWKFIKDHMLYDDDQRHIPVPVFSYIKPTMGPRFLLHIMLSMGEFETELGFILHPTIRDSLRYVYVMIFKYAYSIMELRYML